MVEPVDAMLAGLVSRLAAAGARDEALAALVPEGRVLGIPRPARLRPLGRAWRLGDYLLTSTGELLRTGRVIRVAGIDRRRSVVAAAITEHHELARAARRGGYPEGETVNFDTRSLDQAAVDLAALEPYLAERAELLIHPPQGA